MLLELLNTFLNDNGLLFLIIISPLIFSCGLFFLQDKNLIINTTINSLLIQILLIIYCFKNYHITSCTTEFTSFYKIISISIFDYTLCFSFDSISLLLILLTSFLMLISLLVSLNIIEFKITVLCFFIMEFYIFLAWIVQDLFVFYFCFESVLIPMFIIMNFWGGRPRKTKAAFLLFIYTILGSVWMLLGIIWIFNELGTVNILTLETLTGTLNFQTQKWLWLSFFLAFAVKIPIIPFHSWLPEAHVEAPTGGSVFLAGILLKLGTFGILKILIPLFPTTSIYFATFINPLCICSIIYASLTAIRQDDLKRIIAYASIAHMNVIVLGIFSFNIYGFEGSIFQMVSHGLVSGLLFVCIGLLYDRFSTRLVSDYSGLYNIMPSFCFVFKFALLANMAFPLTSSFIGEMVLFMGIFKQNIFLGILTSIFSIFLGGIYSIWLVNRICYGNIFNQEKKIKESQNNLENSLNFYSNPAFIVTDLTFFEKIYIYTILIFIIIFGIFPNLLFSGLLKDFLILISSFL